MSKPLDDGDVGHATAFAHGLQAVALAALPSACTSVVISLAPEAPSGWPSAIAPPLTLSRAGSAPSVCSQASGTGANASLTS